MRKRTRLTLAAGISVMLWGEWANWRASRRWVGTVPAGSEAVVVLGYRNAGPDANAMNRWRVRAGLRSIDPAAESRLVLCGGACAGPRSEAALMARYARDSRGYEGEIVLEESSRSTWENVAFAIPCLKDVDRIKIVSLPTHAETARHYLAEQSPELAERLVRGKDYRFGEWMPLKPVVALYGVAKGRRRRTRAVDDV
ncbi:GdmH transporter [Nocardia mangyaensis]|uniref:GdmH transporter n=1 Tax=Nocardia mangyaensis TaxID=2213200 RepID=A0A1J0VSP2_9NOCA|nr:YdcF family protein [Nocardia mangyaensis]APE35064.1 GdmH transporter [Nocardia mangyaensis]